MLFGLGEYMTPYNFGFPRLKVKVVRVTMLSAYYLDIFYHIAFIFCMQIGLDRDMNHIEIEVIRSKVNVRRIAFVK